MAAWEASVRDDQPNWTIVRPDVDASGGEKHLPQPDGSILAQGYAPTKQTAQFTVRTEMAPITAFRLELLTDPNLPLSGPGRSILGTAAPVGIRGRCRASFRSGQKAKDQIQSCHGRRQSPRAPLPSIYDDRSGKQRTTGPIAFAIDGNGDTAWCTDVGPGRRNEPRKAVFVATEPIANEGARCSPSRWCKITAAGTATTIKTTTWAGSASRSPRPPIPWPTRCRRTSARFSRSPPPSVRRGRWTRYSAIGAPPCPIGRKPTCGSRRSGGEHPAGALQLALSARGEPRETFVLKRGDFLKPDRPVAPGVPAFLHPLDDPHPTRLSFARWLADRRSPTTARAIVNRVWQAYFGTGLVASSEDLGTQSESPSHPRCSIGWPSNSWTTAGA